MVGLRSKGLGLGGVWWQGLTTLRTAWQFRGGMGWDLDSSGAGAWHPLALIALWLLFERLILGSWKACPKSTKRPMSQSCCDHPPSQTMFSHPPSLLTHIPYSSFSPQVWGVCRKGACAHKAPNSLGVLFPEHIQKKTDSFLLPQVWGSPVPTQDQGPCPTCSCKIMTYLFCSPGFLPFWGLRSNTGVVFTI